MAFTDAPAPMDDYRTVLRKVGLVLSVVAALGIGAVAYGAATGCRSSDARGVLVVAAAIALTGVPLIWGSRKMAWLVACYSAFVSSVLAGIVLVMPFVLRLPVELVWLYLRLQPLPTVGTAALLAALLMLMWWTYRMLTKPVVLNAIDQQAGHRELRPSVGFAIGPALLVAALVLTTAGSGGERGRVREAARKKVGPGYQLFIWNATVGSSGGGTEMVCGDVIAYSNREIRSVHVEFERWR